jgi:exonuclease VII large subunit
LAEHDVAISTQDNRLRMAKDSSNLKATRTLDVHKERIRALYKSLQLVSASLMFDSRVQKIDRHVGKLGRKLAENCDERKIGKRKGCTVRYKSA